LLINSYMCPKIIKPCQNITYYMLIIKIKFNEIFLTVYYYLRLFKLLID